MKILLIIAAVVAATSAQQQCACAPQPITIQLSCGGNSSPQQPPAVSPSPDPEPIQEEIEHTTSWTPIEEEIEHTTSWTPIEEEIEHTTAWTPSEEEPMYANIQDDPERANCLWKNNGAGTFFLQGNTQNDVYLSDLEGIHEHTHMYEPDPYDRIRWWRQDAPKPPRGWDGSVSTLGYQMPARGTELYNLLMCWPLVGDVPQDKNIKGDMDRMKCSWIYDGMNGIASQFGQIEGGFPSGYRLHNKPAPELTYVESPPDLPRPNSAWDGREITLGFPMPEKGTPFYNMLLCWPYDVRLAPRHYYATG